MKKYLGIAVIVAALIACSGQPTSTQDHNANTENPIMPLYYTSANQMVYLTDYVPILSESDSIVLQCSSNYQITPTTPMIYQLAGDGQIGNIHVSSNKGEWDICILPRKQAIAGIAAYAATDSSVSISTNYSNIVCQCYIQDKLLPAQATQYDAAQGIVTISLPKGYTGRSFLRVYAVKENDVLNDVLIPLQDGKPITDVSELTRHDDHAQVLYSLMIDRFRNGNTANDWKMNSPEVLDIVDYQGGDVKGIEEAIEDGYFDDLGATTIWISPITQNPWDAWGMYPLPNGNKYDSTKTYTKYSGYHGYWPIYATALEKRFATPKELNEMLATAHKHNKNVILDYVANHMHIKSPTLQQHPDWHTDSLLPDGRRNFELWDEARLTTWFDVHIPTLDLEREEVYEPMTDSALYWIEQYDFDGYRHDACKHIPECYWRTLTHKMKTRQQGRHLWMIGETYGSPELISIYVKTGMLNAQFDFNIYWTAMHAIMGDQPMSDIDRVIRESMSYYGAHHTMGNISGNHDQVRFASIAGGGIGFWDNGKEEGWTREVGLLPANTPEDERTEQTKAAYRRAMLLEMVNMTIPGVPCIYQGDEYGEVGGNDPDNRHMMRFDNLSPDEKAFRETVKQLINIRRSHMAMLYGQYIPLYVDDNRIEFERRYMNDIIHITISRDEESTITDSYGRCLIRL